MEVKLSWGQVKYLDEDLKKLDVKNAPCAPPLEGMVFKGYTWSENGETPFAFFTFGVQGIGTRLPRRRGGRGVEMTP